MVWLAGGAVFLLVAITFLYLFASASPGAVKKSLVWGLGAAGVVLFAVLLATGRGVSALWAAFMFGPAILQAFNRWRARRAFTSPPGDEGATVVETATLTMRLDIATGAMSGQVRRGAWAGQDLAALDRAALVDLMAECASQDPDSVPLLEAWLDRTDPEWRDEPPPRPAAGPMSRDEAFAILGLAEGATPAEIRAAHRRLMQSAHPDRGGSDWLASRVNEARDLLLG
ncbi:MAG TPA: hypothetical protein VGN96_01730 [Roseococcus sp.]|jgi:hypothetical protein|nr:hypothetical protein [Roseococcus sp.]